MLHVTFIQDEKKNKQKNQILLKLEPKEFRKILN